MPLTEMCRAAGLDILDLVVTKTVKPGLDLNFDFESRVAEGMPAHARIHGTPGHPIGVTVGLTFRFGEKNR